MKNIKYNVEIHRTDGNRLEKGVKVKKIYSKSIHLKKKIKLRSDKINVCFCA